MIVVVGGSSRKAGKTTVMCEIIHATVDAHWTAWKLSTHQHELSAFGDTERYKAAGAELAFFVSTLDPKSLTGNHIVESNAVVEDFTPDLFVFVAGDGEWKESANRVAHKADVVVRGGHATPELIEQVSTKLKHKHGPVLG